MDPHGGSGIYPTPSYETHESKFVRDPFAAAQRPMGEFTHQPESKYVRDPFIHAIPATEVIGDLHHNLEPTKFVNETAAPEKNQSAINICKDTKFLRNECIRNDGIEKCDYEISNHNACLRKEGYLHDLHDI